MNFQLTTPIEESERVQIIALPDESLQLTEGQRFFVSGFGANYFMGPSSTMLKKIEMTAVSHVNCQQRWPRLQLNPGIFCAETSSGDGICQVIKKNSILIDLLRLEMLTCFVYFIG